MKEQTISKEQALVAFQKSQKEAKKVIKNDDKMEKLFRDLERKLKQIPVAGTKLAIIPVMASMVYSWWKKEYTAVPTGSIIAIVGALIYFVSPIDLIPDSIPGIGYVDDAVVAGMCWKLVESDVKDYQIWRDEQDKKKKESE